MLRPSLPKYFHGMGIGFERVDMLLDAGKSGADRPVQSPVTRELK